MEQQNNTSIAIVNGSINYDGYIDRLTPEQRQEYLAIAESISVDDKSSIQVYGSDIASSLTQCADTIINASYAGERNEIVDNVTKTLSQLKLIKLDSIANDNAFRRLLLSVPGLNKFVNTIDGIKLRYNTVQENLESIIQQMENAALKAKEDNSSLETMLINNENTCNRLKVLVIALKLKLSELKEQLKISESNPDVSRWKVKNESDFVNMVSKKIADLETIEQAINQSQLNIIAVQSNNNAFIDMNDKITTYVMAMWKNQIALSLINDRSTKNIEAVGLIRDSTQEIFKSITRQTRINSENAARAGEQTIIDVETLKKCNEEIVGMLKTVRKIHEDGARDRLNLEKTLVEMNTKVSSEIKAIESK